MVVIICQNFQSVSLSKQFLVSQFISLFVNFCQIQFVSLSSQFVNFLSSCNCQPVSLFVNFCQSQFVGLKKLQSLSPVSVCTYQSVILFEITLGQPICLEPTAKLASTRSPLVNIVYTVNR